MLILGSKEFASGRYYKSKLYQLSSIVGRITVAGAVSLQISATQCRCQKSQGSAEYLKGVTNTHALSTTI